MRPSYNSIAARALVTALAVAALPSCNTTNKQEAALMQRQLTRIDERVSFLYRNTKAQADLAANVEELRQSVLTMRGQIEEFNGRSQMLMERMDKIERSINDVSGNLKNDTVEMNAAMSDRLDKLKDEVVKLSLETRAFIQLVEKRNGITWESHRRALEAISKAEGVKAPASTRQPAAAIPDQTPQKLAPEELYKRSYSAYLGGDFEGAIKGFGEYLRLYPKTELSDNAAYWMGESYYSMKDYDRAATAFDDMASGYPDSNKAPAALLKSAMALTELGASDPALDRLKKILDKYPTSNEAIQASEKLSSMNTTHQ